MQVLLQKLEAVGTKYQKLQQSIESIELHVGDICIQLRC